MGVMSALVLAFVLGICIPYIKGKNLLEVTKDFKGIVEIIVKNVIIPLVPIHIAGIFSKLTASGENNPNIKDIFISIFDNNTTSNSLHSITIFYSICCFKKKSN